MQLELVSEHRLMQSLFLMHSSTHMSFTSSFMNELE